MLHSALTLLALAVLLPTLAACDTGEPDPDEIRRVFITEVEVSSLDFFNPESEDGDWDSDLGGGPDVYFDLVNDDTGALVETTLGDQFPDVSDNDLPLVWAVTPGADERPLREIEFARFSSPLAFDLWDEDPEIIKGDDDFMGSTDDFTIQEILDRDAPTLFNVQSDDGRIAVRIRLRYER